jgi:hypothetical protein
VRGGKSQDRLDLFQRSFHFPMNLARK